MSGSQRYSKSRLPCLAGYREVPFPVAYMTFAIRHFPLFSHRFVRSYGKIYELWSPNSSIPAFLPGPPLGTPASGAPFFSAAPPPMRYDGHRGKFDCLHVPQYSQEATRYWAYMRRASTVRATDWNAAAYLPFVDQWVEEGRRGHLSADFVTRLSAIYRELEQRRQHLDLRFGMRLSGAPPSFPSLQDIHRLSDLKSWEEAVDRGVAVQRGLREKEGWLDWRFANASVPDPKDLDSLRERDMPVALDYRMGAWVNGCSELTVLRLMSSRAPVFVVSELDEEAAASFTGPAAEDFLQGTDVETLLSDSNPYQSIARNQILLDAIQIRPRVEAIPPAINASPEQRSWASPSSLLEQPSVRREVWTGTDGERLDWQLLAATQPASVLRPPRPPFSANPPARPSLSNHSRFNTAPPNDRVHFPFSYGPSKPLSTSPAWGTPAWPNEDTSTSAWSGGSHWGVQESERLPRPHAASSPPRDLSSPPSPAPTPRARNPNLYAPPELEYRVIDPKHVPWIVAPDVQPENTTPKLKYERFELREVDGILQWVRAASKGEISAENEWVDRQRKRRLYFGRFTIPAGVVEDDVFGAPVPRYQFVLPRTNALAKAKDSAKAKGKAVAAYDNEDYDDDEPHGMDVDVAGPSEAERPSECVVLDGVDPAHTATVFQALSDDCLRGARAFPVSILNAQQRIWLRFASVTEGQRAFGALPSLARGIQLSFTSTFVFEEAQRYTRDIWTPDLMEDVQSTAQVVESAEARADDRERLYGEPSVPTQPSPPLSPIIVDVQLPPAPPSPTSPTSPPPRSPPQSVTPPPRERDAPAPTVASPREERYQVPPVRTRSIPPSASPASVTMPPPPPPPTPKRVPPVPKNSVPQSREPPTAPRFMRLPLEDRLSDAPVVRTTRWGPPVAPRPMAPLPSRAGHRGNLMSLLPRLSDARAPASSALHRDGQSLVPLPLRLSTPPPSSQSLIPLPLRLSTPEPLAPAVHPLLDRRVQMNNFGEVVSSPAAASSARQAERLQAPLTGVGSSSGVTKEDRPRKKKKPRRGNRAGVQARAQEARREQRRREGFEEEPADLRWNDSDEEEPPMAGPSH
ncbi:hypothetical protein C8R46DRAFT_1212494 [Mycena filopes]|nr:hypothetical protein C8R46DRAFT_1212494 [Mycena filopes]